MRADLFTGGPDPAAIPPKPENSWRWATVINADPLIVRLDGESEPLAASPSTLTGPLAPDQRVWVQVHGRAAIVLGASGGDIPASTDTDWLTPSFQNGWTHVAFQPEPRYRLFSGLVMLKGIAQSGTTDSTIFTLPADYRPAEKRYFPGTGSGGGTIEIETSGAVHTSGATGGTFVFLDVVQFTRD